jgi:hypothetical protein
VLWIRLKSVAGAEYARLNTGGSIIRANSGNGALPTLNGENVGNKDIVPNDRAPRRPETHEPSRPPLPLEKGVSQNKRRTRQQREGYYGTICYPPRRARRAWRAPATGCSHVNKVLFVDTLMSKNRIFMSFYVLH